MVMKSGAMAALAGVALVAMAGAAQAQLGAATSSPVPEGIEAEQSAGFAKGRYHELDNLPDWGGIWFLARGGPLPQPSLKGEYLERWQRWRDQVIENDGVELRSRSNCSPPGLPRIMQLAQYPYEFLFTPGRVTINQEAWMQTRTIWTDGREHPEDPDPTFHGHSIGHWEGDTLVVDTIAISDTLEFGEGGKHSDQFRLEERIHLDPENPDVLVNEMRMTDPVALAEPYEVTVSYRRDRHGALIEFQCAENDRNPVNEDGETLYL
ncbi:hypothetical protein [Alteraurantiacibacter aquimixticola]|uniref:Uncharacterized protein n=1 Tax=Alteraurantiacibacter aquimixticola TaxID=2489173 RepID=A0A4T3F4Z4_9SPHN|nr:hypothetical protein [Alteraurantiacibacter aquimixticola]TIX51901.1 hypothetical protein E5222_05535 [Alteraurantiacibacter aquimixticola]